MKRYLSARANKEPDDLELFFESVAIIIAQHFHISPMEVWNMPPNIVKRLYGWVLAIQDERKRAMSEMNTGNTGGDTVSLDYSAWFDGGDMSGI